jgi:hypothetical protein
MVVSYLRDRDLGDKGSVDATGIEFGNRVVVGDKDEAELAPQADSELPVAIRPEGMALAWSALHVLERRRTAQGREPTPDEDPVVVPPFAGAGLVAGAVLLQLPVGPRDVDDGLLDML